MNRNHTIRNGILVLKSLVRQMNARLEEMQYNLEQIKKEEKENAQEHKSNK